MSRFVLVSGMVQGVGYRAWTQHEARRRGLTGWVRNLADGRVEALLQGSDENIADMLDAMKQGPAMARVTTVDSDHTDAPLCSCFEVTE